MEIITTVAAMSALAHEARLAIFKLLIVAGPGGLIVGDLVRKLKMPAATLSFHLAQLQRAGLVAARREGRRLVQTADFARMNELIGYLTENCCGGAPCGPVCVPPLKAKKPKAGLPNLKPPKKTNKRQRVSRV